MKIHLRLGLLALAAALALASCNNPGGGSQDHAEGRHKETGGMAGMDHGSEDMASGMLEENGNYSDERFIDAMVPHHQGAVEMAQVALQNAEHGEIRRLSNNIISTQQSEIKQLKSIKKREFGTSQIPMEMSPQQMEGMGVMAEPQRLADKEPFDKAFIDAMIPHHQSAIEMARVASGKTENPQIRELAENIASTQQREIEQMEQWRERWYPET